MDERERTRGNGYLRLLKSWGELRRVNGVVDKEFYRKYKQQIIAFEGFHVDSVYLGSITYEGIYPCGISDHAITAAKFAVEEYNKDKVEELKVKIRLIVKANFRRSAISTYFLTLEGTNRLFYEAKVDYCCPTGQYDLHFFRPAKHYPMQPVAGI